MAASMSIGRTLFSARGLSAVFSVFIGECSLDILALRSSTSLFSSAPGVEVKLVDDAHMRISADLFLIAAKLLGPSFVPQLPEEEQLTQEEREVLSVSPADSEPRMSGVLTPSD
jgi:hypothetical protein